MSRPKGVKNKPKGIPLPDDYVEMKEVRIVVANNISKPLIPKEQTLAEYMGKRNRLDRTYKHPKS